MRVYYGYLTVEGTPIKVKLLERGYLCPLLIEDVESKQLIFKGKLFHLLEKEDGKLVLKLGLGWTRPYKKMIDDEIIIDVSHSSWRSYPQEELF